MNPLPCPRPPSPHRSESAPSGRLVTFLLTLALVAFGGVGASAQNVVTGRITDELFDVPLEGVQVMLELRDVEDEGTLATTDSEGRFAVLLPGPGDYLLRTFLPRYRSMLYPFTVDDEDEVVEVLVELEPQPLELEGIFVEVEAEIANRYLDVVGFNRRARSGAGRYVGPEDLEGKRTSMTRVFTGIPGLRVTSRDDLSMVGSGFGRNCRPQIWIDGARLETGFSLALAVSEQNIEAVEVYNRPAFAPAQYRTLTDTGCGIVLIWTRR